MRASPAGRAAVRRRRVAENAEDAMNFKGTVTINAPREKVWQFLTDPTQLTECVPGLESLEVVTQNEKFRAVASIGFGAVKATVVTDAQFVELDPPTRARSK